MSQNFQYESTFTDNVLVLGQTSCGKASLVQSLGKNKTFGSNLLSADWLSKVNLTKNRKTKLDNILPIQMLIFTIQIT